MTLLNSITNAIASIPASPKVQQAFLEVSKEGRSAILVPEAAVTIGRSEAAARRGGFMEFQERLLEEVSGAIVWLWGVDWMRQLFNATLEATQKPDANGFQKTIGKMLPSFLKTPHLSPDIAWNHQRGKINYVGPTAQEMFTRNSGEIASLLTKKSLRWGFSVGGALLAAGIIVPKLNQMKTEWIIKFREKQAGLKPGTLSHEKPSAQTKVEHPKTDGRVQATAPQQTAFASGPSANLRPVQGTPAASHVRTFPNQAQQAGFSYNSPQPAYFSPVPANRAPNTYNSAFGNGVSPGYAPFFAQAAGSAPQQPRFGGAGLGFLQALGHAVEQTPYGSILVVDTGLIAGRGYMASQRSVFETLEIIFRDAVSLYFYIKFAPHVFKGIAAGLDPLFKTTIQLEPKVIDTLHEEMLKRLHQTVNADPALKALLKLDNLTSQDVEKIITGAKILPVKQLEQVLQGSANPVLDEAAGDLRTALRTAKYNDHFLPLLKKEAAVVLQGKDKAFAASLVADIENYFKPRLQNGAEITTRDLADLIADIASGDFKSQSPLQYADRVNLTTAVKQAFSHSVGLEVDLNKMIVQNLPKLHETLAKLPEAEQQALAARIEKMAKQDGLSQLNTMFRRSLTLARPELGANSELIRRMEAQANLIDLAHNRGVSIADVVREQVEDFAATVKGGKEKEIAKQFSQFTSLLDSASAQGLNSAGLDGEALGRKILAQISGDVEALKTAIDAGNNKEVGLLIEHYTPRMQEILGGRKGHLFSLFTDVDHKADAVTNKVNELLKGGLQNDSVFIRKAQKILGVLTEDSREFASAAKETEVRHHVGEYVDKLLKKLNASATVIENDILNVSDGKAVLDKFRNLARNSRFLGQAISVGAACVALGWVVPKLQYALTKKLTGSNVHPGIASVEKNHGKNDMVHTAAYHSKDNFMPLSRNNFSAFSQRATQG